ncbi:MAG: hypothetical protein ABUS57_06365, partial [Pseudomonadota bacterium]
MPIPNDVFTKETAVSYDDLRPKIQNGDILLCSGSDGFSPLIQKATACPWSHVGFIFKMDDIDRVMVLESVDRAGVRTQALSSMVAGNGKNIAPYSGKMIVARHDKFSELSNPTKLRLMSQFAVDRFASPYNAWEIFSIGLRLGMARIGIRLPRVKLSGAFICSEYAAACYEPIGIQFSPNRLGFIAPGDLAADKDVNPVGVLQVP